MLITCPDQESFVRGGSNMSLFFFVMRGGRIQIPLLTGR